MENITLGQRIERARELHKQGYNCSQCVVMVFDDLHGLSDMDAARVSASFGGGFGGQRHLCGTVSGMGILLGLKHFASPADKKMIYAATQQMSERFKAINGSLICGELLASRRKPCMGLIEDAVTLIHNEFCQ